MPLCTVSCCPKQVHWAVRQEKEFASTGHNKGNSVFSTPAIFGQERVSPAQTEKCLSAACQTQGSIENHKAHIIWQFVVLV